MKTNIQFLNNIFFIAIILLCLQLTSSCQHPAPPVAPIVPSQADSMVINITGDLNLKYYSSIISSAYSTPDSLSIFIWGTYNVYNDVYTPYFAFYRNIQPGTYQIGTTVSNVPVIFTLSSTLGKVYTYYAQNPTGSLTITRNDSKAIGGNFNVSVQTSGNKTVTLSNGIFLYNKK